MNLDELLEAVKEWSQFGLENVIDCGIRDGIEWGFVGFFPLEGDGHFLLVILRAELA